jgi:hypothetical protein
MPVVDGSPIPFTVSPAFYGPLNAATQVVRLETDTDCSVLFSLTRLAASQSNARMAANTFEHRAVRRGSGLYISVVENSGIAPAPSHDAQPLGMP